MDLYKLIDIDLYAILILLMIIVVIFSRKGAASFSRQLFLLLCWSTMAILLFDIALWSIDGVNAWYARWLNYSLNFILLVVQQLPLTIWLCYLDYQLHQSYPRLKKRWFYLFPFIFGACVMVFSLFTGFVFSVTPENVYVRGPGIYIMASINFFITLHSFCLVMQERDNVEKKVLTVAVIFGAIPMIGTALQLTFYGIALIWPSVALSISLVYLFLETQKEIRDYLTGLLNRQVLDELIDRRMMDYKKRGPFSIVMIDMDGFKKINDVYGHKEGDRALVRLAKLLHDNIKGIDKAARFGGDEFVILVESGNPGTIESVIDRLYEQTEIVNQKNPMPYNIEFSAGYAVFSPETYKSMDEFFNAADREMYRIKSHRKAKQ